MCYKHFVKIFYVEEKIDHSIFSNITMRNGVF